MNLAAREVELWDAHHESASFNDVLLRSHVALDMSALPALARAIDALIARWLASEELNGAELGRASYFSLPPYMNQLESPQAAPELRDLGQFLSHISEVGNAPLAGAAQDARDALEATIIERSQGSLRDAVQQLGLHVELPLAANLSGALLRAYRERAIASFLATSRWDEALTAYDKLDDEVAPRITARRSSTTRPPTSNICRRSSSRPRVPTSPRRRSDLRRATTRRARPSCCSSAWWASARSTPTAPTSSAGTASC